MCSVLGNFDGAVLGEYYPGIKYAGKILRRKDATRSSPPSSSLRGIDTLSGVAFGNQKRFDSMAGMTFGDDKRFDSMRGYTIGSPLQKRSPFTMLQPKTSDAFVKKAEEMYGTSNMDGFLPKHYYDEDEDGQMASDALQ